MHPQRERVYILDPVERCLVTPAQAAFSREPSGILFVREHLAEGRYVLQLESGQGWDVTLRSSHEPDHMLIRSEPE